MLQIPQLHHPVIEKLFKNTTFSNEELQEILQLEKHTLELDLLTIIKYCSDKFENGEYEFADGYSYNLLIYAVFLSKDMNASHQFDVVIDILHWSDDKIVFWFSDLFSEYFWMLMCHFDNNQIEILKNILKEDNLGTYCKEQTAQAICQIYLKNPDKQLFISKLWTELLEFYNLLDEESVDYTYIAFFVGYICEPNEHQTSLIKSLYEKEFIDEFINGSYDEFDEIYEPEKKVVSTIDLNTALIDFDKMIEEQEVAKFHEEFFKDRMPSIKEEKQMPIIKEALPQRNDPCSCGSGKKYKKCCM